MRLTSKTVRRKLFIMRNHFTKSFLLVASVLLVSGSLWAHHGQGLSFDTAHMWTTWGTIEEFSYINPHPAVKFSRTDKDGNVEHWGAEVSNNPSRLARVGWTKSRCLAALQPGTRVKFYVGTSQGCLLSLPFPRSCWFRVRWRRIGTRWPSTPEMT